MIFFMRARSSLEWGMTSGQKSQQPPKGFFLMTKKEKRERKKSLIEIRTHFGARSALKCFVLISLSKNSMQDLKASLITMTSLVPCDGVTENASAT